MSMINNKMIKQTSIAAILLLAMLSCGDDDRDMQKPEIDITFPENCEILTRGATFTFRARFADNVELGAYNIEIHNNFDHHSHSTDNAECEFSDKKTAVNPWIFNEAYDIAEENKTFEATVEIAVPADVDPGDYHFMVRLTDKSGWQQLAAASVKVE